MNEQVVFALLFELWRDIREPAFLWQVLALGMSLLLAWGLSRYGRQQEFVEEFTHVRRLLTSIPQAPYGWETVVWTGASCPIAPLARAARRSFQIKNPIGPNSSTRVINPPIRIAFCAK